MGVTVMKLQNKNRLILLLAVVLVCGCSDSSEKLDYLISMPKQGDFINGKFSVGDKLPAFTANDPQGVPVLVDQSKYGDRYTVVIFWRSEQDFCEFQLRRYIRLFEQYKRQGLGVISINTDFTPQSSPAIASTTKFPWTSLHGTPENDLQGKLRISVWPSIFLLDHEGSIISYHAYLSSIVTHSDFWSKEMQSFHFLDLLLDRLFKNESYEKVLQSQKLGEDYAS